MAQLMGLRMVDVRRDPREAARRILAAFDAERGSWTGLYRRLGAHRSTVEGWIVWIDAHTSESLIRQLSAVRRRHATDVHARHVQIGRLGGRPVRERPRSPGRPSGGRSRAAARR